MDAPPVSAGGLAGGILQTPVRRAWRGEDGRFAWEEMADSVAVESPLTLRVEGHAVAVVMRTPGHDRELAAGFLLTEGIIRSPGDLFEISLCPSLCAVPAGPGSAEFPAASAADGADPGDSVDVLLARGKDFDPAKLSRHVFTSSSCGICSSTSLAAAIPPEAVLIPASHPLISAEALAGLPEMLRASQPSFAVTGGLHGCTWRAASGSLPEDFPVFEDVGRHNALDKLLGHALLTNQPLDHGTLILSGRISFELVQKAQIARIPLIVAVGAPSSLAIQFAETAGITLCGFTRKDRFNVYTHPSRIG